ncbi:hypothetical protein LFX25_02685 [Leptospira sp. FAT2]|uniref:hypothetical protein n=1 Tax=Leptospira sanjuanensis TaxID=2879643 RepID=UPI001EE969AB|nr:hypothetical protein [Leptospira sanjuanensis]MCG6166757.1 hypothetical protein [Leptospira sanjuanensis]MCG6192149.1 hypothetical protein [Leptospira sanjuanensis]
MRSGIYKAGIFLTMLSVVVLLLDCGPTCGFNGLEDTSLYSESVSPCHQDKNSDSEEERNCEWDIGSVSISESDSQFSKFIRFYLPIHLYSANVFFLFVFSFPQSEIVPNEILSTDPQPIRLIRSVRILI